MMPEAEQVIAPSIESRSDASAALIASYRSSSPHGRVQAQRLAICVATFAILVIWLLLFRWTGDGDSPGHFLNLQETWHEPSSALYPWCRPVYVLLNFLPAHFGITAVRVWAAVITCVTMWTTMRLADRLKLPGATLAGAMFILQPLVFELASDTMTEIPMALGLAIAIHLWWSKRWAMSAVLVSFLPMARPEGFFIIALWGIMMWCSPRIGTFPRRFGLSWLLWVGTIVWIIAGKLLANHWLLFYDCWSWPMYGYSYYKKGPLLHHVYLWPYYCGLVLLVLYIAGLRRSWNRKMILPWTIFLIVFCVHSFLYWSGFFASAGLMRIIACTAPVTAIVCLYGWNAIAGSAALLALPKTTRRAIGWATIALALLWAMANYVLTPSNMRSAPLCEIANYIRAGNLHRSGPRFFCADDIIRAQMDLGNHPTNLVKNVWGKELQLALLKDQPVGTIGQWDNQRGMEWFQTQIEEVTPLGYEVIHSIEYPIRRWRFRGFHWPLVTEMQRYAVLRKVR